MRHRLKGLVGKVRLVDPLCCPILHIGVGISRSSVWHGGNLVLDVQLETLLKLHH